MIQVLLATYNGQAHLNEQLNSLIEQSYQNWKLLIHDDGSTDQTLDIVKKYRDLYPEKIHLIEDGIVCGCAQDNFAHLLEHAKPGYIMFCDQDDVWLKDKVKLTYEKMIAVEYENPTKPVVIHTDLTIVDSQLNIIANSMFEYQKLFKYQTLKDSLVRNNVTGCTMMINKEAYLCSLPISKAAMMHDWWIMLKVLSNGGVIEFVDQPTILYRQHGANSVGAVKVDLWHFIRQSRLFKRRRSEIFDRVIRQAKEIDKNVNGWKLRLAQYVVVFRILRMPK